MRKKHKKSKSRKDSHHIKEKKVSRKKSPFVVPDFSKYIRPEKQVSAKGRPIAKALKELKQTVFEITVAVCWLDGLIVFMLFMLITKLVAVKWFWAFVPAVIYSSHPISDPVFNPQSGWQRWLLPHKDGILDES